MEPIEEAVNILIDKKILDTEASKCIEGGKHSWRYNRRQDEVYCTGCGGFDAGYKGFGVTLLEIKKLLEDIKSGGWGL